MKCKGLSRRQYLYIKHKAVLLTLILNFNHVNTMLAEAVEANTPCRFQKILYLDKNI